MTLRAASHMSSSSITHSVFRLLISIYRRPFINSSKVDFMYLGTMFTHQSEKQPFVYGDDEPDEDPEFDHIPSTSGRNNSRSLMISLTLLVVSLGLNIVFLTIKGSRSIGNQTCVSEFSESCLVIHRNSYTNHYQMKPVLVTIPHHRTTCTLTSFTPIAQYLTHYGNLCPQVPSWWHLMTIILTPMTSKPRFHFHEIIQKVFSTSKPFTTSIAL